MRSKQPRIQRGGFLSRMLGVEIAKYKAAVFQQPDFAIEAGSLLHGITS